MFIILCLLIFIYVYVYYMVIICLLYIQQLRKTINQIKCMTEATNKQELPNFLFFLPKLLKIIKDKMFLCLINRPIMATECGGTAPRIRNIATLCRRPVRFTLRLPCPSGQNLRFLLDRTLSEPRSRCARCSEDKHRRPQPGIECRSCSTQNC
jgi:hypothetical protein